MAKVYQKIQDRTAMRAGQTASGLLGSPDTTPIDSPLTPAQPTPATSAASAAVRASAPTPSNPALPLPVPITGSTLSSVATGLSQAVGSSSQTPALQRSGPNNTMTHQDSVVNASRDQFPAVRYSPKVVAEADKLNNPAKYAAMQRSADSAELAKYNIDRAKPADVKNAEFAAQTKQNADINSVYQKAGSRPEDSVRANFELMRRGYSTTAIAKAKAAAANTVEAGSILLGAAAANNSVTPEDINQINATGKVDTNIVNQVKQDLLSKKPGGIAAPKTPRVKK